jgi:hypothetical protein
VFFWAVLPCTPFFLQVIFGATTNKQKLRKVSFFRNVFHFLFDHFQKFFFSFSIFYTMWYNLFLFWFCMK